MTEERAHLIDAHVLELEETRKEIEEERQRYQLITEDLMRDKEDLYNKLQVANTELSRQSAKLTGIQQEMEELRWQHSQALRVVTQEKDKIAAEVERLRAKLQSVSDEAQEQLNELKEKLDAQVANAEKFRAERDAFEGQVADLKQQLYNMGIEKERLEENSRATLQRLREENELLALQLKDESAKHSTTMQSLLQRIEQLQLQNQELSRKESFDEQLKIQLEEKDRTIRQLLAQKDDLVQRFVERAQDAQTPIEQLLEAKDQLSAKVSALTKQVEQLQAENVNLRERIQMESKQDQVVKLTTAYQILLREKEELASQVTQLNKTIEKLKAQSEQTIGIDSRTLQILRNEKAQLVNDLYNKTVQLDQALREKEALQKLLAQYTQPAASPSTDDESSSTSPPSSDGSLSPSASPPTPAVASTPTPKSVTGTLDCLVYRLLAQSLTNCSPLMYRC